MGNGKLQILLIEDNPADSKLLEIYLREAFAGNFSLANATSLAKGLKLLSPQKFDVVISDINLPDSNGMDTFNRVYAAASDIPIILLTGLGDESFGINAVKKGAADFLNKNQLNSTIIKRSVLYSIERYNMQLEIRKAKDQLENRVRERTKELEVYARTLEVEIINRTKLSQEMKYEKEKLTKYLNIAATIFLIINKNQQVELINKRGCEVFGYSQKEMNDKNYFDCFLPPEYKESVKKIFKNTMSKKMAPVEIFENPVLAKNGERRLISWHNIVLRDKEGKNIGMLCSGEDITEQKIAQQNLAQSEERLSNFMNSADDDFYIFDKDLFLIDANNAALKLFQVSDKKELIGKHITELSPDLKTSGRYAHYLNTLKTGKIYYTEDFLAHPRFGKKYFRTTAFSVGDGLGIISRETTVEKEFEIAIQESEKKYRALVENMNEGILVVDNEDKIEFVNKRFCEMTEYSEKELLGKKGYDILLEGDEIVFMKKRITQRHKGINSQYEIKLKTKTGKNLWILISATPVFDLDGKVIGSMGIHTNITERKKHEQELHSIAKFPEEDPNPVLRIGIDGVIRYSNKSAQILLDEWNTGVGGLLPVSFRDTIVKVLETGKIIEIEITLKDKQFSMLFAPIEDGRYVNIYGRDISRIKTADAEVKKLSFVLGKTDNSIIIADKNGCIEWVNEGFVHLTGYTLNEVKGTHGEVLAENKQTGLSISGEFYRMVVEQKQPVSYESFNYNKNKKAFWSFTTLTPILNQRGNVDKIVAIDSDITLKKEAEEQLRKAKEMSEESSRVKDAFLANMSHEIRTPMNAIIGISQLLEDTELNDIQKNYLKGINFAGDNLLNIINNILDLSKIDAGKIDIECQNFSIRDLLENISDFMLYRAKEKGIELFIETAPEIPPYIAGDSVRLNQILVQFKNPPSLKVVMS